MSEIMKIIDERETQTKKQRQKKTKRREAIMKGRELNAFVVHFS